MKASTETRNLAVRIDAETHLRARMFALEHGVTLGELVRSALRGYLKTRARAGRKKRAGGPVKGGRAVAARS